MKSNTGFGIEQKFIAQHLGISHPTLLKHYRAEIDQGKEFVKAALIGSLFKMATSKKDSPAKATALVWAMKNMIGWRDRVDHAHGGPDGAPLPGNTTNNVVLFLPDNGRDPDLAGRLPAPMKLIEGAVVK